MMDALGIHTFCIISRAFGHRTCLLRFLSFSSLIYSPYGEDSWMRRHQFSAVTKIMSRNLAATGSLLNRRVSYRSFQYEH